MSALWTMFYDLFQSYDLGEKNVMLFHNLTPNPVHNILSSGHSNVAFICQLTMCNHANVVNMLCLLLFLLNTAEGYGFD